MTDKDYEILMKYEEQLMSAYNSNFTRMMGSTSRKELDGVYRSITGRGSRLIYGCSSCIINELKVLATYLIDEKKNKVQNELEPENVTVSKSITKTTKKNNKATNKVKK